MTPATLDATPREPGALGRHAWVPIPVLLAAIAVLWAADLRAVHESRAVMVALNLVFTWLGSLSACVLTARGFLRSGHPGLLMFSCGSLLWGATSLVAATMIDARVNPTITVHNLGALGTAACHFVGLLWRGPLARRRRWLALAYAVALGVTALVAWGATTSVLPVFFVQGRGGTPVRHAVLGSSVALFAWVSWQLLRASRWDPRAVYYWYGLGLGLVATGLAGVAFLSVQGGVLGWTNRLTQYLGSAYLFVAALMAAREAGASSLSLTAVNEALRASWRSATASRSLSNVALRYALAVLMVAAAVALRLAISAAVGPGVPPYLTFFPAIMVVALLAGLGPGVAVTLLAGLVVNVWIAPPGEGEGPPARIGAVLFVGVGLLTSAVAHLYRRYRVQAAAYEREAALSESRARLATFAEATFEGIVQSQGGRIVDCNEQLARMLGYASAELLGMPVADLIAPEDRDRVMASLLAGRESSVEHGMIRKDGTRIVVEAHGRPMSPGSATRHTALRDITQRRRAEDALRDADRRKDEFLGVLSHELRNPLAPIRNSVYLLQRAPPGGDQARRATLVIDRQVTHLARLVDDLLDVTRITRGKIRLQRSRLDLVDVVRRTVDDHRSLLQEHALEVELPDEPVWVDGDATRLAQALGNLLGNAAKFTPPGGKVSVTLATRGDRAVLDVADTGIGIDAETRARLFEPFAQADRSLDRSRGGLGLGLALVKGMVALHGGAVTARSDGPGKGACFTVALPCAERRALARPARPREVAGAGRTVLVIEDALDAAESLADILELWGHRVAVAFDGESGLAKARESRPDVVLCDIGLPGAMDGHAVAAALRREPATAGAHLVALTGYARPEDRRRALDAGFDAHLAKPPDLAVLARILAEAPAAEGRRAGER